ncbi:MAG: hypothetical protein LBR51_01630 [Bacteroidales bacterium]|nr:hypothetical protein [Bacteroidales bacterium]
MPPHRNGTPDNTTVIQEIPASEGRTGNSTERTGEIAWKRRETTWEGWETARDSPGYSQLDKNNIPKPKNISK